jgi:hypothetical protein
MAGPRLAERGDGLIIPIRAPQRKRWITWAPVRLRRDDPRVLLLLADDAAGVVNR